MSEVRSSVKQTEYLPLHLAQSLAFMHWMLDVVEQLPRAQPRLRFLLVATDYFTKWIEIVQLQSHWATDYQVPLAEHNVSLRTPHTIISDNGMNFLSKQVASFCAKYKITHQISMPYYPQGNGQVEISNCTILDRQPMQKSGQS